MSKFIKVKGFEDKKYKVCISIKGKDEEEIISNILDLDISKIDLIEWRVDYYKGYDSIEKIIDMLIKIKNNIGDIPLIFTFKNKNQGGTKDISVQYYIKLIKLIANSRLVDIVNLDLVVDYGITSALAEFLYDKNIEVILPQYNKDENLFEYKVINI